MRLMHAVKETIADVSSASPSSGRMTNEEYTSLSSAAPAKSWHYITLQVEERKTEG